MYSAAILRTKFMIVAGILAIVIAALLVPSPFRDWFVSASVGAVPVDVVVISLLILAAPVTIISIIVSKFNVDFADEVAE